jgi:hypothetical protein
MHQPECPVLSLRTSSTWKPGLTLSVLGVICLLSDVGCSQSISNPNYRIAELNEVCVQISEREQKCADAAKKREQTELSKDAKALGKDNEQHQQDIRDQYAWELARCETETDRENEELSSKERAEYEREAEEVKIHATNLAMMGGYPTSR